MALDFSKITPEMARAELARRNNANRNDANPQSSAENNSFGQLGMDLLSSTMPNFKDENVPHEPLVEEHPFRGPYSDEDQAVLFADLLMRGAIDVGGGLTQAAQGIFNTPHNVAKMVGYRSPSINEINEGKESQNPYPKIEGDLGEYLRDALGMKTNLADKLIQGAASYAPFGLAGGLFKGATSLAGKIAQQAAIGGAYGATQSDNPLTGGVSGAALNAAFPLAGAAVEKIALPIKRATANKVAELFGKDFKISPTKEEAFLKAKRNYKNLEKEEKFQWEESKKSAENLDKFFNYSNKDYIKTLKNKSKELTKETDIHPLKEDLNKAGIEFLKKSSKKSSTSGFSNMMEHQKDINQEFRKTLGPEFQKPIRQISFAKNAAKQNLAENIENAKNSESIYESLTANNLESNLKNSNKITSMKKRIFEQKPKLKSSSKPSESIFGSLVNKEEPGIDVSAFTKDYLSKTNSTGTQGYHQFAKMIGDKEEAAKILRKQEFGKIYKDNKINMPKFLDKFESLNEKQRSFLFKKDELNLIERLQKAKEKDPDLFKSSLPNKVFSVIDDIFGISNSKIARNIFLGNPASSKTEAVARLLGSGIKKSGKITRPLLQGQNIPDSIFKYFSGNE